MKEVWRTPGTMLCAGLCLFGLSGEVTFSAEQERSLQEQVQQLQQQNELLQLQMQRQQVTIEILTKKMSVLEGHPNESPLTNVASQEQSAGPAKSALPFGLGKLNVSGEGGVAYLHSQSQGQFPKGEFRLDEAKLFLEAPVWRDVYFFTELSIALREEA